MSEHPLSGLRVVVTRPEHQAEGLAAALAAAGAAVERLPLLAVVPPADPEPLARASARLETYDWIAFTSANAVAALAEQRPPPWPAGPRLAAVGDATAAVLRRRGLVVDLRAERASGAGLAVSLVERGLGEEVRVLVPLAADARPELVADLRRAGLRVEAVAAYDKALPPAAAERAAHLFPAGSPLGWVTFTSPRIARAFAGLLADGWTERRASLAAASIGPSTSAELRHLGVEPAAQAASPADEALVAAVIRAVAGR